MNTEKRSGNSPLNKKMTIDKPFSLSRLGGNKYYKQDEVNE